MTTEENRVANLRALVDAEAKAAGGKLRGGYRSVATASGLGEEYIYQLYKGHKTSVGPASARAISRAFGEGKPDNWFDLPPKVQPESIAEDDAMRAMPTIGATILHLGALAGTLNPMGRASIAPLLQKVMENPDLAYEAAAMADAIFSAQRLDASSPSLKRALERSHNVAVETGNAPLEPSSK